MSEVVNQTAVMRTATRPAPLADGAQARSAFVPAKCRRTWPRADFGEKVVQCLLIGFLAAMLVLGFALTPSPTGAGTHTLLGLPPCGMLITMGHPCPTCGVTTSFALAVRGQFLDAFVNQPMGLILFAGTVSGLVFAVMTLAAGRSWLPLVTPHAVMAAVMVLVTLGLLSWAYKWSTM